MQALVNGILLGGFYSLMGMGQNIIFGVMNIVNFCHGEMLMVGMYITYVLYTYCGGGGTPTQRSPLLRCLCSLRVH